MNRLTDGFRGASMFMTSDQARIYNRLAQYEDDVDAGRLIPSTTCTWTEDEDGIWTCSDCEINWYFDGINNSPAANECYFCPRCGRRIEKATEWKDSN